MKSIRSLFLSFGIGLVVAGAQPALEPPPAATAPEAQAADPLVPPVEAPGELRDLTASEPAPAAPAVSPEVEAVEPAERPPVPTPEVERPRRMVPRPTAGPIAGMGDAYLPAGERAEAIVSIFGDAQADGPVNEGVVSIFGNSEAREDVGAAVVAVFGNSTAHGNVGDVVVAIFGDATAEKNVGDAVVSVFGNTRVNGHVRGEVVSVFGVVELGPDARVDGDVVSVGGRIDRHPSAVIRGKPVQVMGRVPVLGTLGLWFQQTIGQGRLLAFHSDLVWPWIVALGFLGFYLLLSVFFGRGITRCAETLEQRPGRAMLTALLALIVAPALTAVLMVTVIGAAASAVMTLAALLFGKAAFLAWVGRRFTKSLGSSSPVVATLIGGCSLGLLYAMPVVGLLLWMMGSTLGLGMAVYTAILWMRRETTGASISDPTGTVAPFPAPLPSSSGPLSGTPPLSTPTFAPGAVPMPPPLRVLVSSAGLPRAGFWIRLAASALDAILVGVITGMLNLGQFFLPALAIYCVVMWTKKGTTVGGIVCGLKLVRIDDRPFDWSVAIVRALGGFLSLAVAGLGFIWVAFDADRQSWHDTIAGTTIVKIPKGQSLV